MSIVSESQGSAVKVAHFDCFSGISGDMVLGAVIDAGVPVDAIRAALDSLGLPIKLEVERVIRCGFAATKATIEAADQEDYRFLSDIEALIAKGALTPKQRELATTIFRKLARAEAAAHGMPIERVHFHEVGALDSIADIIGSAVGLDLLGVERFTSSPVPTGTGTVKAAHGLMPVPTPGTLELLKGVPLAASKVEFELTTPTGAAILTTVVSEYVATPAITVEQVGHGAGTKDFLDRPNILRLMVGTDHSSLTTHHSQADTVVVLETNLDDVAPEIIGFCTERLFAAGALDVFVVQGQMKKGRPGVHDVGDLRTSQGVGPRGRFSSAKPRRSAFAVTPPSDQTRARGDHRRDPLGTGEGQARPARGLRDRDAGVRRLRPRRPRTRRASSGCLRGRPALNP